MRQQALTTLLMLTALALAPASPGGAVERQPLVIGVVVDGPAAMNAEITRIFQGEILQLTREELPVVFPPSLQVEADWTLAGVIAAVEGLLADPEVDLVLTAGVLGSSYAGRRGKLPKPVIAPFVLDPELQGIPLTPEGSSGEANLSYLRFPSTLERDLAALQAVVPFSRLAFLANGPFIEGVPGLAERAQASLPPGIEAWLIPVGSSVDEALAAIPQQAEAVYLAPMLHLPVSEQQRLLQGLIDRRLPSFAIFGRVDVERGALAGLATAPLFHKVARRVALNLQAILLGAAPAELPVDFGLDQQLVINMDTARAIGVWPDWEVLTEAELLHREPGGIARQLDLRRAVAEALAANLDLVISAREVSAGAEEVARARSALRPHLEAALLGVAIDEDRAAASLGAQAERTVTGSLALSQLLYSEPVWANLAIQGHLQESRELEHEITRLDIALAAAEAYLGVLRASTLERIQRQNLSLTRANLRLAEKRREIGAAGPGEVYRWQSQLANNRREVLAAESGRKAAELALNRLLHRPLEEPFVALGLSLGDPALLTSRPQLFGYVDNPYHYALFRDFMVTEGLERAVELRFLDRLIAAQQRAVAAAERAFWVPTLGLSAEASRRREAGAGAEAGGLGGDLPFALDLPQADATEWSLALRGSLALFDGGARSADRLQAEEELAGLVARWSAAAEALELRIRAALAAIQASYPGIDLSRAAAAAAAKNLELVTDAYGRGAVSILELLDAQNAARVADQLAANAVYDFLFDLMELERAANRFGFFETPAERDAFFRRLDRFYRDRGAGPQAPEEP